MRLPRTHVPRPASRPAMPLPTPRQMLIEALERGDEPDHRPTSALATVTHYLPLREGHRHA